jgi:NAD(P)-dependent dehydrogenase (short-subunit alcohol dehydrogenase family)
MQSLDLSGKVALVTGGGSGIGEACATLMAARGAQVAVADLRLDAAERVAETVRAAGGDASAIVVDVADPGSVQALVDSVLVRYGGLRIAVNNAGIGGESAPTGDYGTDSWRAVMAVNLDGVFYCTRAEIGAMRQGGGGSIVNMASILGSVGFPGSVAYVAAKHGVVGVTRNAALEHGPDGIRVNAVGPSFIRTPLLESNLDEAAQEMLKGLHPLGRLGTAAEVAELVAWLASDAASFATGGYYAIDGGYLAR